MALGERFGRAAVFVDKDGTLLDDLPYNVDPDKIRLARGAGPALALLRSAGYALVLVSNQGGVARGIYAEEALDAVWRRIAELLAPWGAAFDAIYYCPHDPAGSVVRYAIRCACRKPQPGLLERAAAERHYDLRRSWLIGDILDDVEAGRRAGCRTVLLNVGNETEWQPGRWREPHYLAAGLERAAEGILRADANDRRFEALWSAA